MPAQPSKPVATELKVEQGSDEWLQARIGLITASRFKDVLTLIKTGESAARRNYRAEVVVGRMTGKEQERFKSAPMQWGNETEELAATEYMLRSGNMVETAGIFVHNKYPFGDSPDRLVGTDGCVEIKCYNTANHIEVLKLGMMPREHLAQVQGHMWLANRQWCDFVSFDPDMPRMAQLYVQRIMRDDNYIAELEAELIKFNQECDDDITFLNNYGRPVAAATTERVLVA